jgi:uncharacterized sodium:solute symporter family permease YidK
MIVICITFIPIFQRLNVYTAYEYLENRFDKKTRVLTSLLFLFPEVCQQESVFTLRVSSYQAF